MPQLEPLPELPYAGIPTFLKADHVGIDDLDGEADVAVVGIPFDGGQGKRAGARFGPAAIRAGTGVYAYYGGYKGSLQNVETGQRVDYGDLVVRDCGDVPVVPNDIERTRDQVVAGVGAVAEQAFPVVLGGDHYLTYPSFLGVAGALDADVGVVQIDAHTDTVGESQLYGNHFNGSPMARIAESEHGSYATHAMVGIRGYEDGGFDDLASEEGIHVETMNDVRQRGVRDCVEAAIEHVRAGVDYVYATVDIDAVDPAFAPGTGSPTPGGLTSAELLDAASVLGDCDGVVAIDCMEVAPGFDPTIATRELAAKALVRVLERRFL